MGGGGKESLIRFLAAFDYILQLMITVTINVILIIIMMHYTLKVVWTQLCHHHITLPS